MRAVQKAILVPIVDPVLVIPKMFALIEDIVREMEHVKAMENVFVIQDLMVKHVKNVILVIYRWKVRK